MRTVTTHSTQTKKSYVKPELVKHGEVRELTKGKLGSLPDPEGGNNYSPEG